MKALFLASALVLVTASPAMADRVAEVGVWDCVMNNVGDSEDMAYAHRAQSTIYTIGHDIHFKEAVPTPGYSATVESTLQGERQNYYGIQFDVEWQAPAGMAAMVIAEAGYNVMVPNDVESFAVKIKKPFNYGPKKIVCYKSKS
ncbi:MAG: hypothetical protein VX730_02310 [Pseudomonadota bacterium]|nr:hypothetical protein [Pseudomonadota bacterium]